MYTETYLKKEGFEILKDSKPLFKNDSEEDYPKQQTRLIFGEHLINEEDYDISEIEYNKLKEFNISITKKEEQKKPFSTTMVTYYYLTYDESQTEDVGMIPNNHKLVFDSFTRSVMLIGDKVKKGKTEWFPVDRIKEREKEKNYKDELNDANKNISSLYPEGFIKQKNKYIDVPEIAIGISSHGELVCIGKDMDAPRIGIAGESGQGKSWFIHRLKDSCIDKEFAKVIELNDRKMETGEHAITWKPTSKFVKQLSKIGEITKPMPMIYLHPINDSLTSNHMIYENKIGFKITIPFKEMLKDLRMFECYYDLGKSASYLETLIQKEPNFLKAKDLDEMKEILDENTKTKQNPLAILPPQSNGKIKNFLYTMWRTKILDLTNGDNAKWSLKKDGKIILHSYPWIISLVANLSISIETSHIIKKEYYPILLKFFLTNIFEEKKINPLLRDETLIIFADEIPDLMKNKAAFEVMDEVVRTGRSDGVGFCMATQFYDEILPSIKTNLSHFLIFHQSRHDKHIKQDFFQHHPRMYQETLTLKNKECIACGDYVLYNPMTGKRYSNNGGPIKMRLLPPTSNHKAPPNMVK